jgi:outer membrane protein TolC
LLSVEGDCRDVTLTDALPSTDTPLPAAEALVVLAREHRLDLRALREAMFAGDEEIRLEYMRIFPEISVGLSAERIEGRSVPGRDIAADFARSSLRSGQLSAPEIQTPDERAAEKGQDIEFMIGPNLSLTLPIFDQNQAQVARARYGLAKAVKSYEDLHLSIAQDIQIASAQAETLWAALTFYREELLPQAERSLEYTKAAWQAGTVDVLTLLSAQRNLLGIRRESISAHMKAALSLSDLERAAGLPLRVLTAALEGVDTPGDGPSA